MKTFRLPRNYWLGFWIMIGAYTVIRFVFYEPILPVPRWITQYRQVIRWMNMTAVFVVGILVIRTMQERWLLLVWNWVHLLLMGYLGLAALYEYFIAPMPYGIRGSAAPIIEFLIAPVFYMGLGLLYAVVKRERQ